MDGSSGQWVSASTGPQSISALQNSVINFPSSPTINQVYTINEVYYTYDGVKWIVSTNMSLIEQLATEKAIVMAIALG
jgi:ligand-binding sensor domain-containing protein